jgi:cell wall-associated NlpC family hydrolase
MSSERLAFLDWVAARAKEATPYSWPCTENAYEGKGLTNPLQPAGLDCSGTVTCGLYVATHGKVDWRREYSAARLHAELQPVESPRPGDLAFYGPPGRVSHVMVWWGDGRVVGASGGNRHTTSAELARRLGACVKWKKSHLYRPDFRGFRALPLP